MKTSTRYSPERRERAVRLVVEHQGEHDSQWAAIVSVSAKIGCSTQTLRKWIRRAEVDEGERSAHEASDVALSARVRAIHERSREDVRSAPDSRGADR